METQTKIVSFNTLAPAQAMVERLQSSGITAYLHDESSQQHWQLWNLDPRAQFQVRVELENEARATDLVTEWVAEDPVAAQAVRCPDCGSFKVEYPQFSRKTLIGSLPAALAAVGLVEQQYYCDVCHFTWPDQPPKAEPELDILNWPKK